MSRENVLQAQGEKVLLPSSSFKRRVGDVDYEVVHSDRGRATQIYHLNLLKAWREEESVPLVSSISERGAGA